MMFAKLLCLLFLSLTSCVIWLFDNMGSFKYTLAITLNELYRPDCVVCAHKEKCAGMPCSIFPVMVVKFLEFLCWFLESDKTDLALELGFNMTSSMSLLNALFNSCSYFLFSFSILIFCYCNVSVANLFESAFIPHEIPHVGLRKSIDSKMGIQVAAFSEWLDCVARCGWKRTLGLFFWGDPNMAMDCLFVLYVELLIPAS